MSRLLPVICVLTAALAFGCGSFQGTGGSGASQRREPEGTEEKIVAAYVRDNISSLGRDLGRSMRVEFERWGPNDLTGEMGVGWDTDKASRPVKLVRVRYVVITEGEQPDVRDNVYFLVDGKVENWQEAVGGDDWKKHWK